MKVAQYINDEVLSSARYLVISLDAGDEITGIKCPLGGWSIESIAVGKPLPKALAAIVSATNHHQQTSYYPYVYLDDEQVLDVHLITDGPQRQLILHDVSEVHGAELKVQQKAHEVSLLLEKQAELYRKLEIKQAEIERASEAKSRFIASMSHEFRTPITSIMGHADMLSQQNDEAQLAAAIQRGAWHLLTLVENLLEQARQGEGLVFLNDSTLDLNELLQDIQHLFEGQARARDLRLNIVGPKEQVHLETDELRLRQVLINLLGNAIRYTHEGNVQLLVSRSGNRLTFQVSDTGPGIHPDDRESIFQPFLRLEPSGKSGAGLGLTITRQILEAMGSELNLESEVGIGSTFSFGLDCEARHPSEPTLSLEGRTVLLVDDDVDVLALYELFLSDWGMHVHCAISLARASEQINQDSFDLVFSDLHLDGGSGIDLLQAARTKNPGCATILCSGSGFTQVEERQFRELADEFLMKPIAPDHLRSVILRSIGRAS